MAIMPSTKSALTIFLRISPSVPCCDDNEPLARTRPIRPLSAKWYSICCIHAKFALPSGGIPYCQRGSSRNWSPPHLEILNGGLAITKSALRNGCLSSWKESPELSPKLASIPQMARFICANLHVLLLSSCP